MSAPSTPQAVSSPSAATLAYAKKKVAPASKSDRAKRAGKIAAAVGALALVLGAGLWAWNSRTPAPTAAKEKVAQFIATDKFAELPTADQNKYIDALEGDREAWRTMTEEQRRAAWENLREARETQMLDQYRKLTPAEKTKFLDEQIDREEARRKEWQQRAASRPSSRPTSRPGGGGPGGWGGGRGGDNGGGGAGGNGGGAAGQANGGNRGNRAGNTPERQKARVENRAPQRRAESAQMRADMQRRRVERGLPQPTGPGGGGGGRGGPR